MTKEQDDECFICGFNLAIFCMYFYDENESFYQNCKSLSSNDRNLLLREIIYWRMTIVYKSAENKILTLVNYDDDKSNDIIMSVMEGFYETLGKGLKLKGSFMERDDFISKKLDEYKKFDEVDLDYFLQKLRLDKKISRNDLMHLRMDIPMQYIECKSVASDMIEYLLASPEKKSLMKVGMKLLNQNNTTNKSKISCLNIFLVLILLLIVWIVI